MGSQLLLPIIRKYSRAHHYAPSSAGASVSVYPSHSKFIIDPQEHFSRQ
jgi:hypothetical protein